ncbi:MAG: hypothetical protein HY744_22895 [Deltaproteobacteria bacterium]|nr:hypothetical protein [Deltaproteobacteria bacterium]
MAELKARRRLWSGATTAALLLGLAHAFVDTASGFLIFRDVGSYHFDHQVVVRLVVLYNLVAFAGQVPVGLVADRWRVYRATAMAGLLGAAAALLLGPSFSLAAILAIGLGNAMFHVGAGALVLDTSGDRATESGVFVGPGAAGLATGIWLGGGQASCRPVIVLLLLLAVPLVLAAARLGARTRGDLPPLGRPQMAGGWLLAGLLCALCLAGSVLVRAAVGGAVSGAWRGVSVAVPLLLAGAACAGKMLGGFVSDRLGWIATSVAALVLSAPLVSWLVGNAAAAVVGMLLFQMTMPVTLKATHHLMPERPGLAFGIPCLALVLGALPGLLGHGAWLRSPALVVGLVAGSALLVVAGLRLLARLGGSTGRGAGASPGGARPPVASSLAAAVVAVALLVAPSQARADAVGPPPESCPAGARGETCHGGSYCAPASCSDGSPCQDGAQCRAAELCVDKIDCRSGWTPPDAGPQYAATVAGSCAGGAACAKGSCQSVKVCVSSAGAVGRTLVEQGCGCRVGPPELPSRAAWLALLAGAAVLAVGRRRRLGRVGH